MKQTDPAIGLAQSNPKEKCFQGISQKMHGLGGNQKRQKALNSNTEIH